MYYTYFAENLIKIEQPVQKISAIKEFPKQKETKGNTILCMAISQILISLDNWLISDGSNMITPFGLICLDLALK